MTLGTYNYNIMYLCVHSTMVEYIDPTHIICSYMYITPCNLLSQPTFEADLLGTVKLHLSTLSASFESCHLGHHSISC